MKREPAGNQADDGERDEGTGRTPRDARYGAGDKCHGRRHADESHATLECKAARDRWRPRRNDLAPYAAETAVTRRSIDINFVIAAMRCPIAALTGPQTYTIVHNVRSAICDRRAETVIFFADGPISARYTLRALWDLHELHTVIAA